MELDDIKSALPEFKIGRRPIERVEPALEVISQRLEVIRLCADAIADKCGPESDAMVGISKIIRDVQDELCEAREVLDYELTSAHEEDQDE